MSLSVSTKILDILNHVTLYASAALVCDGITLEAGRGGSSTGMLSAKSIEEKVLAGHLSVSVTLSMVT